MQGLPKCIIVVPINVGVFTMAYMIALCISDVSSAGEVLTRLFHAVIDCQIFD